jgi:hypothetical protein
MPSLFLAGIALEIDLFLAGDEQDATAENGYHTQYRW